MKKRYMKSIVVSSFSLLAAFAFVACGPRDDTIVLRGASQFDDDHAYTQAMFEFEKRVQEYYGKPVRFEIYKNSELGLEKDYFTYMTQGLSVDFAIVSPSHMSTFSKSAPLMDTPFLFEDHDHWNRVLDSDALQPIAHDIETKADVMLIGYGGGGTRHLIVNKPVRNLDELKGLSIRVMGAPIQTKIFQAITAAPTVIAYNEVYNAIQTGVIEAAENEATGIDQMKFYEVGPEISLTAHTITVRPFCFSGKTFRRLPEDLQAAILKAGKDAGVFARRYEAELDAALLAQMEEEGKLKTHAFADRDKLLELVEPVKDAFAEEVGASEVLARVNALKQ